MLSYFILISLLSSLHNNLPRRLFMKRNIRKLLLFACITSMTSFGAQAFAESGPGDTAQQTDQHQGRHERGGKKHHLEKLAKELGLSEQQKTQIKEIFKTSRSQNRQL